MKVIEIHTDGACQGNPGPGGWAALLRFNQIEKLISGAESQTTNNRMELMAAIQALQLLKEPCQIAFYTDSEYLRQGITTWIHSWRKKNWRTSSNEPVKNVDLWQQLEELIKQHKIEWHWVKGHSGHPENERVDEAARLAIKTLKTMS